MNKESAEHGLDMSEAARAMGKRRWHGMSEAARKELMAKARARIKLTKAERSEIGRRAVSARWAKARAAKQAENPVARKERRKPRKGGMENP